MKSRSTALALAVAALVLTPTAANAASVPPIGTPGQVAPRSEYRIQPIPATTQVSKPIQSAHISYNHGKVTAHLKVTTTGCESRPVAKVVKQTTTAATIRVAVTKPAARNVVCPMVIKQHRLQVTVANGTKQVVDATTGKVVSTRS